MDERLRIVQLKNEPISDLRLPDPVRKILSGMVRLSTITDRRQPLPYQSEILTFGCFRLTDNFSSSSSVVIDDKSVLYSLAETSRFKVIATNLSEGFPLLGLVDLDEQVCFNLGNRDWGVRQDHIMKFQSATRGASADASNVISIMIMTGDANFAHVLWNQLSALEISLRSNLRTNLYVVATHEPLGRLDLITNGLKPEQIIRIPDFELVRLNSGPPKTFVPLAGSLIDQELRKRLVKTFVAQASERAQVLIRKIRQSKVLFLSIRSRNRTPINLVEVLSELCVEAFRRFPSLEIVLDGHSLPADFNENRSYDRRQHMNIVQCDLEIADKIRNTIEGRINSADRIHTAIGFDVRDSVAVGALGAFYFAHHGTVQHKLGWIHDIPGVVHSNPTTTALDPARWVVDQVEGGSIPSYLPIGFVMDTEHKTDLAGFQASLHHENYVIRAIDQVIAFVLNRAAPFLCAGALNSCLTNPQYYS